MAVCIRALRESDVDAAATMVHESFRHLAAANNAFSFIASSREHTREVVGDALRNANCKALVAVIGDDDPAATPLGFVAVNRMGSAWDLGPVGVALGQQSRGLGRTLVRAGLAAAAEGAAGGDQGPPLVFLTVDTYNMPAVGLYADCGFDMTKGGAMVVMEFSPRTADPDGPAAATDHVRLARPEDHASCAALSRRHAALDLGDDTRKHAARLQVVCRAADGAPPAVVGYVTQWNMSGHLVADDAAAATALLRHAEAEHRAAPADTLPRICVPLELQPEIFRGMLARGWRCVKALLMMTHGRPYALPEGGVYFPQC